jgi:hypothetical protein
LTCASLAPNGYLPGREQGVTRKEFHYSRQIDLSAYFVAVLFALFAAVMWAAEQWLTLILLAALSLITAFAAFSWRANVKPFLVVDDDGIAAPTQRMNLSYDRVVRAYCHRLPASKGGRDCLILVVRDASDLSGVRGWSKLPRSIPARGEGVSALIRLPRLSASPARIADVIQARIEAFRTRPQTQPRPADTPISVESKPHSGAAGPQDAG